MNLSDCAMCGITFVKGAKGYGRIRLRRCTTLGIAQKFCRGPVCLDNFVCRKCERFMKKTKKQKSFLIAKKKLLKNGAHSKGLQLPVCSPSQNSDSGVQQKPCAQENEGRDKIESPTSAVPMETGPEVQDWDDMEGEETQKSQSSSRSLPIDKVIAYLTEYKYLIGLRALSKVSATAKQALITVVAEIIKNEIKSQPKIKAFQQRISHSAVSSFSWVKAMEEAQESLPATVQCIWAMLPLKKKRKYDSDVARKAVQMLNIALYTRSRNYKFVPSSVALELFKLQASKKVISTFNHIAISQSKCAIKGNLNAIRKEHEQELLNWKESQEKMQADQGSQDGQRHDSYGFGYSRVQLGSEANAAGHSNTQTICFAVKDRAYKKPVKRHILAGRATKVQVPAAELDPYTFLPSPEVFERRRSRAVFLVKHLITKHLTKVQHLKEMMPSRILHSHTKEMDEKSQCVTLGVVDANPGSKQGMISVLERLQNYMPVKEGKPTPCLLSGDIEPILHAQRHACSEGEDGDGRFVPIFACPQEYQKELLHVQESNKRFFKASSITDRGTIAQLRNQFNLRLFKNETNERYQHAWDMYEFVTESHILLCAMKLCGVTSLEDEPEGLPSNENDAKQLEWLTNLAHRVVDFCWSPPEREDVHVAAASYDKKLKDVAEKALRYCRCNAREKSDDMVLCCARTCKHSWFHLDCLGLKKAPDSEDDWYCSKKCQKSASYIYCFCHTKQPVGVNMVQCHLAEQCKKYVWYHQDCVSTSTDAPLPDTWYCSEECALEAENDDHVLNHTKALMYEGLCHLIRRQAVSEGNGPAMVDDWKADMLNFHEWGHWEYLATGHYFLACVEGFADPELQFSFLWNRVANPKGTPGGNVGLDAVHECVNLDNAGVVKPPGGSITPDLLARYAQLKGPFGRDLGTLFAMSGPAEERSKNAKTDCYNQGIQRFTKEYQSDALFDYIPGREHAGFGVFENSCQVENPKQLGRKLQSLSAELDLWKSVTTSCRET
ncbi:uncharacterized protein LOC121429775 [Lytechinus variegatus]|uniref:uncharacterized protein LOC121429775 n=1 Tax=Lytechinus variegatus TaxID=7654 RepID=UPI001BB16C37|nr:uncharacterized protein LOC121429775 [Lytechinus variegatus]